MENFDEQQTDQEFVDAFNAGYFIGKYAPELKELLNPIKADGTRFEAFAAGMEQYTLEQEKEKMISEKSKDNLPDFLKKHSTEDKSLDPKNPDRDIEPER